MATLAPPPAETSSLTASMPSTEAANQYEPGALSSEQLLDAYRTMLLIRHMEESLLELAESGKIGGAMHTAIGHEANAVGVALALDENDYVTGTYRGHHHAIAWGMDPGKVIAEVLGRVDGVAKGKGGSMHLYAPSKGVMETNGIVGGQVPHGAGMALAAKLRGEDKLAITFFGDGANFQGVMHETYNIAQKWRLPCIFYCENNRYSEMTPISRTSSVAELYKFAQAYGMKSLQIDGNDVDAVYQATQEAAEHARGGDGPVYIEALTYRFAGHMAGDLESYREAEEIEESRKGDPIAVAKQRLLDDGVSEDDLRDIQDEVEQAIKEATEFAENSPWPDDAEAYTDVFAY